VHVGLKERFRELCDGWTHQSNVVHVIYKQKLEVQQNEAKAKVAHDTESLRYSIHETVVQEVLRLYP